MSLEISQQTETRLAAIAREQGLTVDAFLQRLLGGTAGAATSAPDRRAPELPVWHLGARSLCRADIYDDVR
jgi:hypothetical protein